MDWKQKIRQNNITETKGSNSKRKTNKQTNSPRPVADLKKKITDFSVKLANFLILTEREREHTRELESCL